MSLTWGVTGVQEAGPGVEGSQEWGETRPLPGGTVLPGTAAAQPQPTIAMWKLEPADATACGLF